MFLFSHSTYVLKFKSLYRLIVFGCLFLVLCQSGLTNPPQAFAQTVWHEQNGSVVIQSEDANSIPGAWQAETSIPGFTGGGYIRWNGANEFSTPGQGVIQYDIKITNPGSYRLYLRNHHDHPDHTEENDAWTKMNNGPWVKTYSSTGNTWNWHTMHEPSSGQHEVPIYTLSTGIHTFFLSGRSHNFRIDKIVLTTSDQDLNGLPDSPTNESSQPTPIVNPGPCEADINQDGTVDLLDYSVIVNNFFKTNPNPASADVNRDGVVDLTDYSLLVKSFLKTCG